MAKKVVELSTDPSYAKVMFDMFSAEEGVLYSREVTGLLGGKEISELQEFERDGDVVRFFSDGREVDPMDRREYIDQLMDMEEQFGMAKAFGVVPLEENFFRFHDLTPDDAGVIAGRMEELGMVEVEGQADADA